MRIGIDASLSLRERSGIAQYIHHLISALGKIDSHNQYILGFMSGKRKQLMIPSYGIPISLLPQLRYRVVSCR